jgi:hypothetical protein
MAAENENMTMIRALVLAMVVLLTTGAVILGIIIARTPAKNTYYPVGPAHITGITPSPTPRCSTGQADIPGVNC